MTTESQSPPSQLSSSFADEEQRAVGLAPSTAATYRTRSLGRKPRVLFLVDTPNWAFDYVARNLARALSDEFRLDIKYVRRRPRVKAKNYDLLYVFFWGEQRYKRWGFSPDRIIKEVSSHRWRDDPAYGPCAPGQMVRKYLRDAAVVACTSELMKRLLETDHPRVYLTPNGVDPRQFRPLAERAGPLRIGWCGNPNAELKGLQSILEPACAGRFELKIAGGDVSHSEMNQFYNSVDVFAIASRHEGQPITLVEAMAAGCFPVCNRIGIVPELVRDGENGLIVKQRSPEAYRQAFAWCEANLDHVRRVGSENAEVVRHTRDWNRVAYDFRRAFRDTLQAARKPKFRNDDISCDTDLSSLRRFFDLFHRWGHTQLHGVTLRGRTNSVYRDGQGPCEYEGIPSIGALPNDAIRRLSGEYRLEDRGDLIEYLNSAPDEIALHGLYHTDYSAMSADQQRQEIGEGLERLEQLFPRKLVRYFIAPFNRVGRQTAKICREFNLHLLAGDGIHLEAELPNVIFEQDRWYRYHHHRFYPQSSFDYYPLNFEMLEDAFRRGADAASDDQSDNTARGSNNSWLTALRRRLRAA